MTEIELFECFNVKLANGNLWNIKPRKVSASKEIETVAGEPGSKERIEFYRQQVELGNTLFGADNE